MKVKEISREDKKSKQKESNEVSPTSKGMRYANQTAETLRKEPNSSEDCSPKPKAVAFPPKFQLTKPNIKMHVN